MSFPISTYDASCVILITKSKNYVANEPGKQTKKLLIIILKDFIKQPTIKQSLAILSFSFLIDCSMSVSSVFFYQSVCKYLWQAFTGYKNGEKLKILIKVFCDKLIVSGVILTFLDHVKAKIFFVIQPWWLIYSTPSTLFWKSLDPPLYVCLLFHILVFNNIFDQCLFCCYEKFFLHEKVVKIKKWLALNLPLTSLFSNVL